MMNLLWAQTEAVPAAAAQPHPLAGMFPLVFIFVLFYFLMIRPQQKKVKEHQELLKKLKKGDKIVAAGGIVGHILEVREHEVEMEISSNSRMTVLRSSIQSVLQS